MACRENLEPFVLAVYLCLDVNERMIDVRIKVNSQILTTGLGLQLNHLHIPKPRMGNL